MSMSNRLQSNALIFLALVTTYLVIRLSLSSSNTTPPSRQGTMSSKDPTDAATTNHTSSTNHVKIILSQPNDQSNQSQAITLTVSLTNTHPTRPLTLLPYDSPLDPTAFSTGALTLTRASSGEAIASPGLKLNRVFPPPKEDLVEVPAGESVARAVEYKVPWLGDVLEESEKVVVSGKGVWKGIWRKKAEFVTDGELKGETEAEEVAKWEVEEVEVMF